ncbi:MAG: histidine kinase [Pseudomonadota bacterium]
MNWPRMLWRWNLEVVREWRWRHSAIALLLVLLSQIWSGNLLCPYPEGGRHLVLWSFYHLFQFALPLVYAIRVADRAVDAGAPLLLTYGAGIAIALLAGNWLGFQIVAPFAAEKQDWILNDNLVIFLGWYTAACIGVAAYVHWRQERRALALLQLSELKRARYQQELQAARLLALQARVEPKLLFDTLQRIDELITISPLAADALLADMIALLRAMLPIAGASASTVEREFALVHSYARVTGSSALQAPQLTLDASPEAEIASLAPMVLLPTLRALTSMASEGWRIKADRISEWLRLSCEALSVSNENAKAALRSIDLVALRARLVAVHGAQVVVRLTSADYPGILIELPYYENPSPDR